MTKYLDTPCGKFPRRENFDKLTDVELLTMLIERQNKSVGFVCPEVVQEMKDRGLPELYMTTTQIEKRLNKLP